MVPDREDKGISHDGASIILEWNDDRLEASGRGLLGVLALLVEAGAKFMPAELPDRLGSSLLLSDERLLHDTESLSRIRAALNRRRAH